MTSKLVSAFMRAVLIEIIAVAGIGWLFIHGKSEVEPAAHASAVSPTFAQSGYQANHEAQQRRAFVEQTLLQSSHAISADAETFVSEQWNRFRADLSAVQGHAR